MKSPLADASMARWCDTGNRDASARSSWLAWALGVAIVVGTMFASLTAYYLPPEKGEFGVVFPPWIAQADALGAVIAAGGHIADTGRFSNVVVVRADDAGFARRVLANGAWAVTAARGLCGPLEETV